MHWQEPLKGRQAATSNNKLKKQERVIMACYFERKNAIKKDPMQVVSGTLAFGLEICFIVALGFVIMSASPKPAPNYEHAAKVTKNFVIPADAVAVTHSDES